MNSKMDVFDEGDCEVIAFFGGREHNILSLTRKDDLQIVIGNLEKL